MSGEAGNGMAGGEDAARLFNTAVFLELRDRLLNAADDPHMGVDETSLLLYDIGANMELLQSVWEVDDHVPDMLEIVRRVMNAQHHTPSRDFYLARGSIAGALFSPAASAVHRHLTYSYSRLWRSRWSFRRRPFTNLHSPKGLPSTT